MTLKNKAIVLKFIIKWVFLSYGVGLIAIFFETLRIGADTRAVLGQICIINITAIACMVCNLKWNESESEVFLSLTISIMILIALTGLFGNMRVVLDHPTFGIKTVVGAMIFSFIYYIWLLPKTNAYQLIIQKGEIAKNLNAIDTGGQAGYNAKIQLIQGMTRDDL